ncbi:MAG TPA: c-type cytochrome, partial [Hanamia sp.]
ALIFLLIGYHIYLVFRNGISEPPKAGRLVDPKTYRGWYKNLLQEKGVPFWPNAVWRDAIFSSLIIIFVVVLAVIIGPPELTSPPNPSVVLTNPRPDWYILPIFALFALMPPQIESVVIFIAPLLTIVFLLALPFISNKGERSALRRPWAIFGVVCVVVSVLSLLVVGIQSPWSPNFTTKALTVASIKNKNPSEEIKLGVNLFYSKGCQYCHTINNYGGKAGPELTDIGRTLSPEQLKIRIANGGKNMPAYGGTLKKDELNALVAFLKTQN